MKSLNLKDKKNLVLPYCGEVTWAQVNAFTTTLLECFSQKDYKNTIIIFSSSGGEVDASWSLYTSLMSYKTNLITVASGKVYSAAVLPYLAGKSRYVLDKTLFLIHPSTAYFNQGFERSIQQLEDEIAAERIDEELLYEIYTNKVNKSFADTYRRPSNNNFITADTSLKIGLSHKKVTYLNEIKVL